MKKTKDEIIKELKSALKFANEWKENYSKEASVERNRANSYRSCLREILMELGQHGTSLSHKWIGSKIGEMLK